MEIEGFYKEVIDKLSKRKVDFLLVGGLAVGFHGHARFTGDMDLWINPENKNMERLGEALVDLKYTKDVVAQILKERPIDHPTPIRVWSEGESFKVDLMTSIYYEPLTFEACKVKAVIQDLGATKLPVIGLKELIEIKSNVKRYDGNMKDLVDAHELRKILARSESKTIEKKPSTLKKIFKKKNKGLGM